MRQIVRQKASAELHCKRKRQIREAKKKKHSRIKHNVKCHGEITRNGLRHKRRKKKREWLILRGRMGMIIASNSTSAAIKDIYHAGGERCEVCHLSFHPPRQWRETDWKGILRGYGWEHFTKLICSLMSNWEQWWSVRVLQSLASKYRMTRHILKRCFQPTTLLPPFSSPLLPSMSFLLLGRFIKFPLGGLAESRAL